MVPAGCWFVMGALAENSQVGVGRAETSFDYDQYHDHYHRYIQHHHNDDH